MSTSSQLSLEVRREGDTAVVSARGDIDLSTLAKATAALDGARAGARSLVLDLRDVGFMDTSGLSLIIEEQRRAAATGYRFAVIRGSRRVQRLFEIAGLADDSELFVDPPADGGGE
ncbi:MAG TPA: STAS domain-containing protein [Solirubrobacteraceae bacterium]|nr:STAS domain-containing protein [Solirubrobacteraceae bacterium]